MASNLKASYGFALAMLGTLVAVPAALNLIQHLLHIGLVPVLDDFLSFYRGLFAPLNDLIFKPVVHLFRAFHIDLAIPQWVKDIETVSILSTAIILRLFANGLSETIRESPSFFQIVVTTLAGALLILIVGLMFGFLYFSTIIILCMMGKKNVHLLVGYMVEEEANLLSAMGWATVVAIGVFYVSNHLMRTYMHLGAA